MDELGVEGNALRLCRSIHRIRHGRLVRFEASSRDTRSTDSSAAPGYPLPQEWAKAYVREHMIYLCHLDQPHMRHMTTDYCRWLLWCTNNFYVGPKRILMFRSLEKMFRAYEDAFFDSEEALRSGTTQESKSQMFVLFFEASSTSSSLQCRARSIRIRRHHRRNDIS
jgi:hypothetical protein